MNKNRIHIRWKIGVLIGTFLLIQYTTSFAADSPFDFAEPMVVPSPAEGKLYKLDAGDSVVDFDVAPDRPEVALLIKLSNGKQKLVFWYFGDTPENITPRIFYLSDQHLLTTVTWHPLGRKLFFLDEAGGKSNILISSDDKWDPKSIFYTQFLLRRLVVAPRPFEIGYDEKTRTSPTDYRIFFGVKKSDGKYATHTVTESGKREYAVIDSKAGSFQFADDGVLPNSMIAISGLPVGFHPAGHFMIWEDVNHCFQKIEYSGDNWGSSANVIKNKPICNGSLTYTPNGAALLHWRRGINGIELKYDRGEKSTLVASDYRFISTPSSVADGKGIVGISKENGVEFIRYVPINVPLADVVNAWMFAESPKDRELLSSNTGLFRSLEKNQLYELYDTESYHCGGYDQSTPSRPYFVTTDIFWELYAAAFEGIFILSERQGAMPVFWDFVARASQSLKQNHPESKMAKAFAALSIVQTGMSNLNPEADLIMKAEGTSISTVTNERFNFGNLKPRSHYTKDSRLGNYFRASKYLIDLKLANDDIEILKGLPPDVISGALAWVKIYEPFIVPPRRPLIWAKTVGLPDYISKPESHEQVFPLSWGIDNEVFFNTVYHDNWPEARQIKGPKGLRLLPSGMDIAAVLGSQMADLILEESGEYDNYPPLKQQITELKKRIGANPVSFKPEVSLYSLWLSGLATQWSDDVLSPNDVIQKNIWQRKRLQTGLASWATLRHATVLVNERSAAECGEAGFEPIVLRPPRGYVEPDPETLDAIARLFTATIDWVKANGKIWKGNSPTDDGDASQGLQDGVLRRLTESRDKILVFREIAKKELDNKQLTNREYEEILYVARAAEHNYLIFKSLAQRDFALSTPDPIPKVADVASAEVGGDLLLVGVGYPIEWDQIVPFFGRKQVVKGVTYSYYETTSKNVMTDKDWASKVSSMVRPKWISPYFSSDSLSCPAKAP